MQAVLGGPGWAAMFPQTSFGPEPDAKTMLFIVISGRWEAASPGHEVALDLGCWAHFVRGLPAQNKMGRVQRCRK
jgi:hypothetical protein